MEPGGYIAGTMGLVRRNREENNPAKALLAKEKQRRWPSVPDPRNESVTLYQAHQAPASLKISGGKAERVRYRPKTPT